MSKNPLDRNITRINGQPKEGKKPVRGYEVRIFRRGQRFNQFFSDSVHGGQEQALLEARKVRDAKEQELKRYTRSELAAMPSARNTSGERGIRVRKAKIMRNGKEYIYDHVEVSWSPKKGHVMKKSFSINKLGKEEAWAQAVSFRKSVLDKLVD